MTRRSLMRAAAVLGGATALGVAAQSAAGAAEEATIDPGPIPDEYPDPIQLPIDLGKGR